MKIVISCSDAVVSRILADSASFISLMSKLGIPIESVSAHTEETINPPHSSPDGEDTNENYDYNKFNAQFEEWHGNSNGSVGCD